jgi:hypothetical protein
VGRLLGHHHHQHHHHHHHHYSYSPPTPPPPGQEKAKDQRDVLRPSWRRAVGAPAARRRRRWS